MPLNFPSNPIEGNIYIGDNGVAYRYANGKWKGTITGNISGQTDRLVSGGFNFTLNSTGNLVLPAGKTILDSTGNSAVTAAGNYSNVNLVAYLTATNYLTGDSANLANYAWSANISNYSNVQVATYLPTYSGRIANITLSPSGSLTAIGTYGAGANTQQTMSINGTTFSITGSNGNLTYQLTAAGVVWNKYDTSPSYVAYYYPNSIGLYRGDYSSLVDIVPESITISALSTAKFQANQTAVLAPNVIIGPAGRITFADGTTQTTAGGGSYSNVQVATYLPTYSGAIQASNVQTTTANIQSAALSTSTTTGALRVMGGIGIGGNAKIGGINGTPGGWLHEFSGNIEHKDNAGTPGQLSNAGPVWIYTGNILAKHIRTNETLTVTTIATIGNLRLGPAGNITFADGTTQTTASAGGATQYAPKSLTLLNPVQDQTVVSFYTTNSVTLTKVRAVVSGNSSPSVTYSLYSGTSITAALTTHVTHTVSNVTVGNNAALSSASIPGDRWVWATLSNVSGVVSLISITMEF